MPDTLARAHVTATGRMWGYTQQLDIIERRISRGLMGKRVTFEVTDRSVIGTRGWYFKRTVSKYEYRLSGPRSDVKIVAKLIDHLAQELS